MPWNGIERRKHKRYGLKGCTVQYRPSRFFGLLAALSPRYLVLNISPGGFHFISKEKLKSDQSLYLSINAPLLNEPIKIKGQVVWSKKSEQYNAFRSGIKFLKISKSTSPKLKFLLDNALLDKIDISTRIYLDEVEKLWDPPQCHQAKDRTIVSDVAAAFMAAKIDYSKDKPASTRPGTQN